MKNNNNIKIILVLLFAVILCFFTYYYITKGNVIKDFVKTEDKGNSNLGQPYIGTLYVPDIELNHGFVSNETNEESCMEKEVCAFNFTEQKPEYENSKVLIGSFIEGKENNAFKGVKKLKYGSIAYVEINNIVYKYKLYYVENQSTSIDDMAYGPKDKRQLLLLGTYEGGSYFVLHFNYLGKYYLK